MKPYLPDIIALIKEKERLYKWKLKEETDKINRTTGGQDIELQTHIV